MARANSVNECVWREDGKIKQYFEQIGPGHSFKGKDGICCRILLLILMSLAITPAGRAATLVYFADPDIAYPGYPSRGLYNFDTETGISTFRTAVAGESRFFALDLRPSDATLFACSLDGGLWTLNINTGVPTFIGSTGITEPVGLAFNPITGDLYGLQNNGGLYSVDMLTGAFSFIGSTGQANRGLSFSPSGQLYAFSNYGDLFSLNPLTGNATAVGGNGNQVLYISEDSTFTRTGELYAADYSGNIFLTNPITGNGTKIGNTGVIRGTLGLVAIPEPCTILLLGLGGLAKLLSCQRKSRGH